MQGAVWVASPLTRSVLRVRSGEGILERVELANMPTSCILGGADGRTLFISTVDNMAAQHQAHGFIESVSVDVPGA